MKKSIFAVLAVSAISGAYAQSNVTLYGTIDEGFLSTHKTEPVREGSGRTTTNGLSSNVMSATKFGLKGAEDLGSGSQAIFNAEIGLNQGSDYNTNKGNLDLRQAYVGLQNSTYGKLTLGKQYTEAYEVIKASDASKSTKLAGSIFSHDNVLFNQAGNSAKYSYGTPLLTGFVNYATDSGTSDGDGFGNAHSHSVSGIELGGKGNYGNLGYALVYGNGKTTLKDSGLGNFYAKQNYWIANANYDFGIAKVGYTYFKTNYTNPSFVGTGAPYVIGGSFDHEGTNAALHQISVTAPITAQLDGFASILRGSHQGQLRGGQIGLDYKFSKRTDVYAAAGTESHYRGIENGERATTYGFGLRHSF